MSFISGIILISPPLSHLAGGHEEGEGEDEGALGHGQPVGLLQGEEDGAVQTGFGRAAGNREQETHRRVRSGEIIKYWCFMLI